MNVKLRVLSAGAVFFMGAMAFAQTTKNDTITKETKIDEVIVVAYGAVKKETLTGSVGQVKAAEIAQVTAPNVIQGMTGKIAGVQVYGGSGQPGQAPTVRFRGIGSVNGSAAPLYVVDGVPYTGDISTINNNDIESISFLKDASVAALYGNRGANGVIIVTTKKGRKGRTRFALDMKTGINQNSNSGYKNIKDYKKYYEAYFNGMANNFQMVQGLTYDAARVKAADELVDGAIGLGYNIYNVGNTNLVDPVTGQFNSSASLLYTPEDWEKYLFRDGYFNSVHFNAAGGSENTTYLFSVGYDSNEGYGINSKFDKVTARAKVDTKVGERITVGTNFAYTNSVLDNPDGNGTSNFSSPYLWINSIAPIYGVYQRNNAGQIVYDSTGNPIYDDGTGMLGVYSIRPYGQQQNPYITALLDHKRTKGNTVFASAYAGVNILKGLDFKYTITGDYSNNSFIGRDTPIYGDAVAAGGRLANSISSEFGITNQQLLNYSKNFNGHKFEALVGHETYENRIEYTSVSKSKLFLPNTINLNDATIYQSSAGYNARYATEGYFARINYDYNSKYYLSANFRRDASSMFHPDNRWGNFYGFGGAWRVSKENFMKDVSWVNEFKLKASYGEQGNDNLALTTNDINEWTVYTPYMDLYAPQPQTDPTQDIGWTQVFNGNKDITWEKLKNSNFGFETSLFNNRLNIDAEYFQRNVTDMLFNREKAPSSGFDSLPVNLGSMTNKGFEVTMDADVIRTSDFRVNLFGNITHYKNEITDIYADLNPSGLFTLRKGHNRYTYRLREFAGVNAANGNAVFYKDEKDASGNVIGKTTTEIYNEATYYVQDKVATPDVYGGFGLNLQYKGFDLGVDFSYQFGGWGYDSAWMSRMSGGLGQSIHEDYYNTWTPTNTSAALPKFVVDGATAGTNSAYATSTLGLIKSDFISLQNISLGYTLNKDLFERFGLTGIKFYATANNLAVWSKRKGYDPRLSLSGSGGTGTYNLNRTFVFGTTISF